MEIRRMISKKKIIMIIVLIIILFLFVQCRIVDVYQDFICNDVINIGDIKISGIFANSGEINKRRLKKIVILEAYYGTPYDLFIYFNNVEDKDIVVNQVKIIGKKGNNILFEDSNIVTHFNRIRQTNSENNKKEIVNVYREIDLQYDEIDLIIVEIDVSIFTKDDFEQKEHIELNFIKDKNKRSYHPLGLLTV